MISQKRWQSDCSQLKNNLLEKLKNCKPHSIVEKAVGPELDAPAGVILRHAANRQQSSRWPAGVRAKIHRRLLLNQHSGDLAGLEHLVLDVVNSIFPEAGLNRLTAALGEGRQDEDGEGAEFDADEDHHQIGCGA